MSKTYTTCLLLLALALAGCAASGEGDESVAAMSLSELYAARDSLASEIARLRAQLLTPQNTAGGGVSSLGIGFIARSRRNDLARVNAEIQAREQIIEVGMMEQEIQSMADYAALVDTGIPPEMAYNIVTAETAIEYQHHIEFAQQWLRRQGVDRDLLEILNGESR